jgi:hypothetical protein
MLISNLLLVAGTGTKSGKTSLICRIIELFPDLEITAIKITPHFHETTSGLKSLEEGTGYAIYEETYADSSKDTSRMLKSGAHKVYFAKVWDDQLFDIYEKIMKLIPSDTPVICESPALRNFVEPGVFAIIRSESVNKNKDVSHLQDLPHVMFKLEELQDSKSLPFGFENGKWFLKESA